MKLSELEPVFIRLRPGGVVQDVKSIGKAQGIRFRCPVCYRNAGTLIGVHSIICWSRSRRVPDEISPGPGRWLLLGTTFDDLTLGADPPARQRSVLLTGGCGAHFHVTRGEVTFA